MAGSGFVSFGVVWGCVSFLFLHIYIYFKYNGFCMGFVTVWFYEFNIMGFTVGLLYRFYVWVLRAFAFWVTLIKTLLKFK